MAFRVSTTTKAKRDSDAILSRLLSQEAGEAGLRWFQGLREAVASLAHSPQRCALAPENAGRKPRIYRVLFTIEGETVSVLHIRHGRRQAISRH